MWCGGAICKGSYQRQGVLKFQAFCFIPQVIESFIGSLMVCVCVWRKLEFRNQTNRYQQYQTASAVWFVSVCGGLNWHGVAHIYIYIYSTCIMYVYIYMYIHISLSINALYSSVIRWNRYVLPLGPRPSWMQWMRFMERGWKGISTPLKGHPLNRTHLNTG